MRGTGERKGRKKLTNQNSKLIGLFCHALIRLRSCFSIGFMVQYARYYVLCRAIFLPIRDNLYNLSYPTRPSRSSMLACSAPVEMR